MALPYFFKKTEKQIISASKSLSLGQTTECKRRQASARYYIVGAHDCFLTATSLSHSHSTSLHIGAAAV